jgi:hypothetical protein
MRALVPLSASCVGAESLPPSRSCDAIWDDWIAQYDALVADNSCAVDEDCHALWGGCEHGLGGCQEAVHVSVSAYDIESLTDGFLAEARPAGCLASAAICDCPPKSDAACVFGVCQLLPPEYY